LIPALIRGWNTRFRSLAPRNNLTGSLVGRERFELCRPVPVKVLDPTVISRVLLGL
jgi:hypothetical protein